VAVAVLRRAVVLGVVVAVDVVDEAVAVVVAPVAAALARVGVEVRPQVGMLQVDPAVDDRDGHGRSGPRGA
jgi:hypothetical protein